MFLPDEGCKSVEDTLATFSISDSQGEKPLCIDSLKTTSQAGKDGSSEASVTVRLDRSVSDISVPAGPHAGASDAPSASSFVPVPYHNLFLAELMLSHRVKDFCVIGPRGCGKSAVVQQLADLLGYETEPIMLYQDMTAR